MGATLGSSGPNSKRGRRCRKRGGKEAWESHWGCCVLTCRKNVTESPSFSSGDNPPVLFSSDFRISGAPEKYEVRARVLRLQASWKT